MSQHFSTLPALVLTAMLVGYGVPPTADAQQSYGERMNRSSQSRESGDSYSQSDNDSSSRDRSANSNRYNRRDTDSYNQSSSNSRGRGGDSGGRSYGQSQQGWQSSQGGGNTRDNDQSDGANSYSRGRSNNEQNRSSSQSQQGGWQSSQGRGDDQNDDQSNGSNNDGQRDSDQRRSTGQSRQGGWQSSQRNNAGGQNLGDSNVDNNANSRNNNASWGRNSNQSQQSQQSGQREGDNNRRSGDRQNGRQDAQAAAAISPAMASAILPSGWKRVASRDVPALPATLPSLPAVIRSDDGVNVNVTDTVRIIASGDDIIAVIEAMGMGNTVFGAPENSITSAGQAAPHHVRFNQRISASQITDIDGTLFIANSLRRYRSLVSQVRSSSSMPVVVIDDTQPATDRVQKIASAFGFPAQGRGLSAEIQRQFDRAQALSRQRARRPKVAILVANEMDNRPMYAGDSTQPGEILRNAGGQNIANEIGVEGYGSTSEGRIRSASPEIIVISEYDLGRLGGPNNLWNAFPGLKQTPAGQANRIMVMPDLQLKLPSVAAGAGALALSQALNDIGDMGAGRSDRGSSNDGGGGNRRNNGGNNGDFGNNRDDDNGGNRRGSSNGGYGANNRSDENNSYGGNRRNNNGYGGNNRGRNSGEDDR